MDILFQYLLKNDGNARALLKVNSKFCVIYMNPYLFKATIDWKDDAVSEH